jgi:hypothetical protein
MLLPEKVEQVRRLLAAGEATYRDIAKLAGVSRTTVQAIALNRRREPLPKPEPDERPVGPPVRCPGCGGLVYAPCVLCRIRRLKAAEAAARRRTAGRDDEQTRRRNDPTRPA